MRRQLDEMEKGDRRKQIEGLLKEQRVEQSRQRDQAMKELEKTYPADARTLVAMRLRRFLDVTKDVDYDAQLVDKGKKKVFADASLEVKPAEWKVVSGRKSRHRRRPRRSPRNGVSDLQAKGSISH